MTNPQTNVTPTHEIGAVAPDMQRVVVALGRGVPPTCAVLQANFDALIESTLKGPVPACLRLRSFAENLRVWDVVPLER